jgi:hypothetical protein
MNYCGVMYRATYVSIEAFVDRERCIARVVEVLLSSARYSTQ